MAKTMSKLMSKLAVAAAGTMALLASNVNQADAFQLYTDRMAWQSALDALGALTTTETFDNPKANASTITFDSGVISTGVNGTSRNLIVNGRYEGWVDGPNNGLPEAFETITWQFPNPIFAFGADWISTATGEMLGISGNFDGTGEQTISFLDVLGRPGTGFLGIIGEANFSQITFTTTEPDLFIDNEFYQVDNLSFASATTSTPVPEPGTIAGLAIFGLGGLFTKKKLSRSA